VTKKKKYHFIPKRELVFKEKDIFRIGNNILKDEK